MDGTKALHTCILAVALAAGGALPGRRRTPRR